VVAYCRGPYCVMAVEAVALLRKKGYRPSRMELRACSDDGARPRLGAHGDLDA
jgi:hypothetical protein